MVIIGSDRRNQLNKEIASLKAKLEIMRRDLEAMGANLEASVEVLEDIKNESKESRELPSA